MTFRLWRFKTRLMSRRTGLLLLKSFLNLVRMSKSYFLTQRQIWKKHKSFDQYSKPSSFNAFEESQLYSASKYFSKQKNMQDLDTMFSQITITSNLIWIFLFVILLCVFNKIFFALAMEEFYYCFWLRFI